MDAHLFGSDVNAQQDPNRINRHEVLWDIHTYIQRVKNLFHYKCCTANVCKNVTIPCT